MSLEFYMFLDTSVSIGCQVLLEDVRQLCIHDRTKATRAVGRAGGVFPWVTHKSHLREEKRSSLEDLMSGKHKVESESWNVIFGTSAKFDVARCY